MSAPAEEDRDKRKTNHIDKPLGEKLRLERDARGFTRARLAEMLDVSDSTFKNTRKVEFAFQLRGFGRFAIC